MANRFERLYKLPDNLYADGSPIIISAAALLKDNETGNVLVQLKLHSISGKKIKALKISVSAFDISGKPLPGIEDYQYLDLDILNGQYFGSQKAIIMPEAVTRVFSISAFTVVFEDLSTWAWDESVALKPMPNQEPLFSILQSEDLVVQYQFTTSEQAKFDPVEFGSLWLCSCGEANSGTVCTNCRIPKSVIFSALNKDNLSVALEKRLARERKLREEEIERQRIYAEEAAAKKAAAKEKRDKLFKWAKIASIPLTVILLAIMVFSAVGRNNKVLTLDKVLAFETKEDVVSFLGKPGNADGGDSYDVSFLGNDYLALFYYDNDGFLSNCNLSYFFEGATAIKKAADLLDYVPTGEDISAANEAVAQLLEAFTEKFGVPDQFDSSVNTTTYTWLVNTTQIELVDSIANEDLSLIGAVDLRFNYNVETKQRNSSEDQSMDSDALIVQSCLHTNVISAGHRHTLGLKRDGTVVVTGDYGDGQCNVSGWSDIKSLAAGIYYSVGLKKDGTVVTAGGNYYGQCNVSEWMDIVAISAGFGHTVGLKSDGTVMAVGWNEYGQCEVSNWSDIVSIAAGHKHTLGLRSDGTVVASGDNSYGRCDVSGWNDIVAVATGIRHSIGLKSDGTVVAIGSNDSGQCNVSNWEDIIAVAAGEDFTVGLRSDGTVIATGWNVNGQCDVSDWEDIVSIAAGESHTVGLRADGFVVAVGLNDYGQCEVASWDDICLPS